MGCRDNNYSNKSGIYLCVLYKYIYIYTAVNGVNEEQNRLQSSKSPSTRFYFANLVWFKKIKNKNILYIISRAT